MSAVKVINLLGTTQLLSSEKGITLFNKIKEALKEDEIVELDFSGYEFISSSFINRAFGDLCLEFKWDPEIFNKKIVLSGIDEDDKTDIDLAIYNAYHKNQLIQSGKNLEEYYSTALSF